PQFPTGAAGRHNSARPPWHLYTRRGSRGAREPERRQINPGWPGTGDSMDGMTLPQSSLGRTGLSVTKLGYGAMEVRGPRIWRGRPVEDAEAEQILNAVVERGI